MVKKRVRVLWSGITGRTGSKALIASKESPYAYVVAGICRTDKRFYNYEQLDTILEDFDVIVDFSHRDSFSKVLNYAVKVKKPLIIGTAGLSEQQKNAIEEAAKIIPIFRGGNFMFAVKEFIDDVVNYAKNYEGVLTLVETHYKTKTLPSQTSKVIAKRVLLETGKEIKVESHLEYDEFINDYRIGNLHCHIKVFENLARDVLKIASMLVDKEPGVVYDLDKLLEVEK